MIIYRCEDSLESIFTAIYLSYEEKRDKADTCLMLGDEPVLFGEDIQVVPDVVKAGKVIRTLTRRFGEEDYYTICLALSSEDPEKVQAVFRTVVYGLKETVYPGHLFDSLANDDILKVFRLARQAGREIHHLQGFIRFEEQESGILYSRIGPKCNALTFLMPHFADRFPGENFVIYDENRGFFGIHPAKGQWYLKSGTEEPELKPSANEIFYGALFCAFVKSIAIEERKNLKLQQNLLPLRYREYMLKFR